MVSRFPSLTAVCLLALLLCFHAKPVLAENWQRQDVRTATADVERRVDELSRRDFPSGNMAQVALSRSWNTEHEVITFHSQFAQASRRERRIWLARRVSIDRDNYPAPKIQYADGRTCPAIDDVLIMVEQLESPMIDLRGVPDASMDDETRLAAYEAISTDDHSYALSVAGFFDTSRSPAKLTIGGNSNTPIGALAELARPSLEPCWSDEAPDLTVDPY